MPITVQRCPLCNSCYSALFDQRLFRNMLVSNRLCMACGLVFQSPRMSDEELAAFYEQEYRSLYQGDQGPNQNDLAVQAARAEALLAFIKPQVQKISRHLDIGCSAGLLLQRLQVAYSCQSVGVEPGIAYRQYAQAIGSTLPHGLKVYTSIEECHQAESGAAPFDLVSLAHVLEHLPDPVSYLSDLRHDLLAEGGWLLVEIPNLYGHDCFEIAHLVSYSPHTLAQTLMQAGFKVQRQETHGRPRSQSIPLYITTLCTSEVLFRAITQPNLQKLPQTPVPERGVRLKRQIAMLRRRLVTRLAPKRAWLPAASFPGQQPKEQDFSPQSK